MTVSKVFKGYKPQKWIPNSYPHIDLVMLHGDVVMYISIGTCVSPIKIISLC